MLLLVGCTASFIAYISLGWRTLLAIWEEWFVRPSRACDLTTYDVTVVLGVYTAPAFSSHLYEDHTDCSDNHAKSTATVQGSNNLP